MFFMKAMILVAAGVMSYSPYFILQKRDRVVKKLSEGIEAVEITSVEVEGKPIEAGRRFYANDDWLKSLKIRGENISDKAAINIVIVLSFEQLGLEDFEYSFAYGAMPQSAEEARVSKKIKPNEIVDIQLSEAGYENLRTMLAQRGYPHGVEAINISIGAVTFDDLTLWRHGKLLRPDPSNPKKWRVIKPTEKESSVPRAKQSEMLSRVAEIRFVPTISSRPESSYVVPAHSKPRSLLLPACDKE